MPTTVTDVVTSATAAGITDVIVTRVWPSVATVTATFSSVYPDQIGEFSPNVARAEDEDSQEYPFCALFGAIAASEDCIRPSDDNEGMCKAAMGLVTVCGTISDDEVKAELSPEEIKRIENLDTEDLKSLGDLKNLKLENLNLDKRSFLHSYSGWCDSFDDSNQAQEQDTYTQQLLAEGAAGFFGVEIETDEQRGAWFKIGQEFHKFYCGDEGGARDLWELISTVEPWNELATATSVPITLVWEGGEAATPTSTPTPTQTPEPTPEGLDEVKKAGLQTSEHDANDEDDTDASSEPQERYFDFDTNTWATSLLTVHETPDAAVQTGYLERDECDNCERGDCPYCGQGVANTSSRWLFGGVVALGGLVGVFGL